MYCVVSALLSSTSFSTEISTFSTEISTSIGNTNVNNINFLVLYVCRKILKWKELANLHGHAI